jgi:hypothetical protein
VARRERGERRTIVPKIYFLNVPAVIIPTSTQSAALVLFSCFWVFNTQYSPRSGYIKAIMRFVNYRNIEVCIKLKRRDNCTMSRPQKQGGCALFERQQVGM